MKRFFLFKVFFVVLLLFFWRTIVYWENFDKGGTEKDLILYIFMVASMLLGAILIGKNYKSIPFKPFHHVALAWFLLMITVALYNKTALSLSLKCCVWPIIYEVTYIFSKQSKDAEKFFRKYFLLLAIMGLFVMLGSLLNSGFVKATNLVYFFILPMPFLLKIKDKQKLYWLFIVMASMAVLSSKRSMILAMVLFFILWEMFNTIKRKKVFQSSFLLLVMAGIAVYSFQNFRILSEGRLVEKMNNEDVSNGRERIYDMTMLMIERSSIDHKILGNGHNAVRRDSPLDISAHNEWLEIMYDYGAIAIMLYLCLWIIMLSNWYKMYKTKSPYYVPYTLMICIWGVMSMVSQLILYVSYVLYLFMFLAYVEGCQERALHYREYSSKRVLGKTSFI